MVAIKRLSHDLVFRDSYHAKKVYREIILLKQLVHDNVVKLIDLFISGVNDIYIVTEKMDCDLSHVLIPEFEMNDAMVQYIMYGLLRGLKYIHSAGVIHRDLKPSNILLNCALDARICDFGLARGSNPETLATGYVTTRWYRAPEVMLTWQHYTAALDIWSAGCIFGEMLNKVRNHVTTAATDTNGQVQPLYALFPAESHVDHLEKIILILGPPTPEVIDSTTDTHIATFLRDKVAQLHGSSSSLDRYFHNVDPAAVSLLLGLLDMNPKNRFEATQALAHPYLSKYHEPSEERTRTPLDRSFESLDLSTEAWSHLINRAVSDLSTIHSGEASPQASDPAVFNPADSLFPPPDELFDFDDSIFRETAGLDDLAAFDDHALLADTFALELPERMPSLPFDSDPLLLAGLEGDRRYLQEQLQEGSAMDAERILVGLSELDAQRDTYQQQRDQVLPGLPNFD
eukprot:m.20395 g.20395  ORF g.20395 m.20395 type:complete len:458 (-) comp8870_c0_seq1:103-1476(-)